jgi:hypothetical protein
MWEVSGQSAIDMSSFQGGEKHLYFYVGNFTQTAIENTAGLNAELFNGKVDLNAANLSAAGKHVVSNASMPSATVTALTLGASGATYTAPADGYFVFRDDNRASVGSYYLYMFGANGITSGGGGASLPTTTDIIAWLPCRKGAGIGVYYSLPTLDAGETRIFNFIKTQGDA